MKGSLVAILVVMAFIRPSIAQQNYSNLTLKQCVELAHTNNIPLKQNTLNVDRAKVNYQQAKTNLLPTLNGSYSYGFSNGRTIDPITNAYINEQITSSGLGLSAGLLLFNGLQLQNLIKQTSLAYDASRQETQQQRDNLTLNVLLAYLTVLSNEDVLAISKNQADVTRNQVGRMEVLVKEGSVGTFQLTDLKGQLAGDEINIVNNTNSVQTAKLNLCQLMNIPYNPDLVLDRMNIDIPLEKYAMSSDQIYQSALENLALVKAVDLRVASASKNVKVQQGNLYPSISLGANFNTNYSSLSNTLTPTNTQEVSTGDYVKIGGVESPVFTLQQNYNSAKIPYFEQFKNNRGTNYGISMQVPILNGFFARNQVKLARINLKDRQFDADNTKNVLRQNIEQAYQNMSASYERFKILTDQVNNFKESFRAAEIRFNNGAINSTEYLLVKNTMDRSSINLAQARYDFIFRTRILDFYQGKLAL